jgi:hypothetical protein
MRLAAALFLLSSLASAALTASAFPAPPATHPAHDFYDSLNNLRLDPASIYQIKPTHHITLRRGDAKISFDEGQLIFFSPLDGRIYGAVFAGRGHILTLPREISEKQQLARFLGTPILDQDFVGAYIRFTDTTADDLLRQFHSAGLAPQTDPSALAPWDPVLARLSPAHSLRTMFGTLISTPCPYFYASLDGTTTGPFDVLLDPLRFESFLLGQGHSVAGATSYDVWASYNPPDTAGTPVDFHAPRYTIDTSILPDHSLEATATITIQAENSGHRLLTFNLSRALNVDSVTDATSQPLEFFQNQGLTPQQRSLSGNDYLYVVLPESPRPSADFSLRFHYRGGIIDDAGNNVLFVSARESWYPHLGDSADFAMYDLTMRWPRKLRLIATGEKIDEREDAEFRVGHWQTAKPVAIAGFNLGEYASTTVTASNYSIDVYANQQVEQELARRLEPTDVSEIGRHGPAGLQSPMPHGLEPLPPNPAAALKLLGNQIDASIHFYESYSGPFPFRTLSVSQIPGTFGQGWPGLLYVSTFSFLSADAQRRAGLSSSSQEHFTEIVPFHEAAHQWWGNVVGWSNYHDQWIDEAIANYLALLFADTRKNPDHTLRVWLQRYREQLVLKAIHADEPASQIGALTLGTRLNSSKSPNAYDDVIYAKGSWVIHMLREMLRQPGPNPDARFHALLNSLVTRYAYRALSTQDLRREIESVMTPSMDLEGGKSMEWFFEQWVKGTGVPHYRVEFSSHPADSGYTIRGKLFQTDVPASFIARIPLYAGGSTGHSVLLGTVVAAGPETPFHFNSPTPARKLQIDPQMTILCTTE